MPFAAQRRRIFQGKRQSYLTLPPYLQNAPPQVFEGFETFADWSAPLSGSSIADNTTEFSQGSHALKLTTGGGNNCRAVKTVSALSMPALGDFWSIDLFPNTNALQVRISLYTSAARTRGFSLVVNSSQVGAWGRYQITKAQWLAGALGGAQWTEAINQIEVEALRTADGQEITIDNWCWGLAPVGAVLWGFHEGSSNFYTQAFPIMRDRGFRGTLAPSTGTIGAGGSYTWAQQQEMLDAGWGLANHTRDHLPSTTIADYQTDGQNGIDDFTAHGLSSTFFVVAGGITLSIADQLTVLNNLGQVANYGVPGNNTNFMPFPQAFMLRYRDGDTPSLATLKAHADALVQPGTAGFVIYYSHGIGGANTARATLEGIMDYYAQIRLPVITAQEFVALQAGNAVTIPVPWAA